MEGDYDGEATKAFHSANTDKDTGSQRNGGFVIARRHNGRKQHASDDMARVNNNWDVGSNTGIWRGRTYTRRAT